MRIRGYRKKMLELKIILITVWVICGGGVVTADEKSGAVRLVGKNDHEGTVEVYYNGQWGTVCDDGWDINDANVVCNQLEFNGASSAESNAYFGSGSGSVLLDNVDCAGDESSLDECSNSGWLVHDCSHLEDAGVRCNKRGSHNIGYIFGAGAGIAVALICATRVAYRRKKCQRPTRAATVTNHVPPSTTTIGQPQVPSQVITLSVPTVSADVKALNTQQSGRPTNDYATWETAQEKTPGFYSSALPSTNSQTGLTLEDKLPPLPSYQNATTGNYQG